MGSMAIDACGGLGVLLVIDGFAVDRFFVLIELVAVALLAADICRGEFPGGPLRAVLGRHIEGVAAVTVFTEGQRLGVALLDLDPIFFFFMLAFFFF